MACCWNSHAPRRSCFSPFASRVDAEKLSRDWNSYAIRNDEEIVKEIVARYGLPPGEAQRITHEYLTLLENELAAKRIMSEVVAGADELLISFAGQARLGIATANFRKAAELRLKQAGLWGSVSHLAHGADGGGHKSEILGRAINASGLPSSQIIFIGDNVNDVQAGLANKVHFIGFSLDAKRRAALHQAGAARLVADHADTARHIEDILSA